MPQNTKPEVLVIGDAMEDHFIEVRPVWNPTAKHFSTITKVDKPGGAANTADILQKFGFKVSPLYSSSASTNPIVKTYIQDANGKLLMRINGNDFATSASIQELRHLIPWYTTVVVSDYKKGTINGAAIKAINEGARYLYIDTKRNPLCWRHDAVFFPNEKEYTIYKDSYDKLYSVVHKQGERGARFLRYGKALFTCPPPRLTTPLVSATGAGDAFLAAWVYSAIVHHRSARECLKFAVFFASLSCCYPFTDVYPPKHADGRFRKEEEGA